MERRRKLGNWWFKSLPSSKSILQLIHLYISSWSFQRYQNFQNLSHLSLLVLHLPKIIEQKLFNLVYSVSLIFSLSILMCSVNNLVRTLTKVAITCYDLSSLCNVISLERNHAFRLTASIDPTAFSLSLILGVNSIHEKLRCDWDSFVIAAFVTVHCRRMLKPCGPEARLKALRWDHERFAFLLSNSSQRFAKDRSSFRKDEFSSFNPRKCRSMEQDSHHSALDLYLSLCENHWYALLLSKARSIE